MNLINTQKRAPFQPPFSLILTLLLLLSGLRTAQAQLAITEFMTSAALTSGTATVLPNSDFWELTNFGTNAINLNGYRWNDNQGGLIGADPEPFKELIIAAGESIIFFQTNSPASGNSAQFLEWWGSGLPNGMRAVLYSGNGLSSVADGIRLWGPEATEDADVIDSVDFDAAVRGSTFVYNPGTGKFDTFSTNGVNGAFKSAKADDVGSPGTTTGPVPLSITAQPRSVSLNPGDTATLSVTASGLPRPFYQWYFGDQPIEGARFASLRVTNVIPSLTGSYSVRLSNGFQSLESTPATLSLNFIPEAPQWVVRPVDASLFVGQGVRLISQASGVPLPSYRWFFNGVLRPGATDGTLELQSVALNEAGTYAVVASNLLGQITQQITLRITLKPKLSITEIMPVQNTNGGFRGHNDWFELTNFGQEAADLTGYRFDDSSATLAAAITFTNQLSIAPGESIVFVENMTPEAFRDWWGPGNFKSSQQIVTYRGAGLSLSSLGDAINLWNSGATQDFDTVASEVYSTATNGVSFTYNLETQIFGDRSVEGEAGAWTSYENGDIGSPGAIRNPSNPRILRFSSKSGKDQLVWTAIAGSTYLIEQSTSLINPIWVSVSSVQAIENRATYERSTGLGPVFYRIVLQP